MSKKRDRWASSDSEDGEGDDKAPIALKKGGGAAATAGAAVASRGGGSVSAGEGGQAASSPTSSAGNEGCAAAGGGAGEVGKGGAGSASKKPREEASPKENKETIGAAGEPQQQGGADGVAMEDGEVVGSKAKEKASLETGAQLGSSKSDKGAGGDRKAVPTKTLMVPRSLSSSSAAAASKGNSGPSSKQSLAERLDAAERGMKQRLKRASGALKGLGDSSVVDSVIGSSISSSSRSSNGTKAAAALEAAGGGAQDSNANGRGGHSSPVPPSSPGSTPVASGSAPVAVDLYNPLLQGCRSVDQYQRINYIDEGAYGMVYCARNRTTGEVVALKLVKISKEQQKEGFPITALRETNVLLSLHHPNIVNVKEMVVGSSLDKVYMVMEYFDHDLKWVMERMKKKQQKWTTAEVKCLMLQLLRAIEYLHRHWYIHRDIKSANLLYNQKGKLAVCDFGLARRYEDPIRPYTALVVTLWYRPPELLLGKRTYSTPVDIWGVGCIFGELLLLEAPFQAQTELEQLGKIFETLGVPTEERWPGWSKLPLASKMKWKGPQENKLRDKFKMMGFSGGGVVLTPSGFDLLTRLLELDPAKRLSAEEALAHPWFQESPPPCKEEDMPVFTGKNDSHIEQYRGSETAAAAVKKG